MASVQDLELHRAAVMGHCYRMLGSVTEADDAVQETMIRAWKALDRFEGRSSLRTWLYRIASRVCLDALADRARRRRPMETGPAGTVDDQLTTLPATHWVEPIADVQALPSDADPSELALLRESVRLAFVAALQHLPPRGRVILLLVEVLGWSAAEVAASLEMSAPAVNSTLQRARATLASRGHSLPLTPLTREDSVLVDRYVEAFERYDVAALTALLHQDATLSMPPYSLWLRGPRAIADWLLGRGCECRGSRLIRTSACGSPAYGQYRPGGAGEPHRPWSLTVLEIENGCVTGINAFLDTAHLFPRFGLPSELEPDLGIRGSGFEVRGGDSAALSPSACPR